MIDEMEGVGGSIVYTFKKGIGGPRNRDPLKKSFLFIKKIK